MILKAKHNFFIYPFFQKYTLWKTKRFFHEVRLFGHYENSNKPLLLICNHISWWDGFWLMHLNIELLKRKFHFMMLESQLRKFWFFNYSGGFSVNKHSRSVIETINYTSELLCIDKNMVIVFPQGKINSMHQHKIHFEKGIDRIVNKLNNDISILFVAHFIDYYSKPKPTLCQYIKEYPFNNFDFADLETKYQFFYSECIENQTKLAIQ